MKKIITVIFLITLALNFSGCRNNSKTISETASPSPAISPAATPTPVPSPTPIVKSTPAAKKVLTGSGVYNGLIDSNSIEVTFSDGEIKSYQLTDKLAGNFGSLSLKEGDKITFEYTVSNGQYTIQTIKK